LFRVELANGHGVLAHPARRDRDTFAGLAVGGRVQLEMSPFDMSNGRLLNGIQLNGIQAVGSTFTERSKKN